MTDRLHGLLRHIPPTIQVAEHRLVLALEGFPVGWVLPDLAAFLATQPGIAHIEGGRIANGVGIDDRSRLPALGQMLAHEGWCRWRDEAFDVRALPEGPVLGQVDRGALPCLGLLAEGVHVNGLVQRAGGLFIWLARRGADRPLDPGKLDHVTAGGIAAGSDPVQTLVREAEEEAGIPAELADGAIAVGQIAYTLERPEGLRRDLLHCYDLYLPESFTPHPNDNEVTEFMLWPVQRVLDSVCTEDTHKFNTTLVLIDLFLRHGLIDPHGEEGRVLRAALQAGQV